MTASTLTPGLLQRMNAYWRAANYLSVGQMYLFDNPLLKRPLALTDVKPTLSITFNFDGLNVFQKIRIG